MSSINIFILLTSFATATGIILHDTRIDKAAAVAVSLPIASMNAEVGAQLVHLNPNDFHTHVERTSVARAVNILHSSTPGIAPRATEDKKHLMQRYIGKGHHPFDNYNLPIV